MFDDLEEQKLVFGYLDEWSACEYDLDLTYLTGSKSNFSIEITKLIDAVQNIEKETIEKNPKLKLGFSSQSELLHKLLDMLNSANSPAKLNANLNEIKLALMQANNIGLDLAKAQLKADAISLNSAKDQLQSYRQGRSKNSISPLHKTLAVIFKNAGQPSFKSLLKSIDSRINNDNSSDDDTVILQELEENNLSYLINGVEKSIKLTSIQSKITDYKKWIAENII